MTNQEIISTGQTIANETHIGGNTAERVGGVIQGIGENLTELAGELTEEIERNLELIVSPVSLATFNAEEYLGATSDVTPAFGDNQVTLTFTQTANPYTYFATKQKLLSGKTYVVAFDIVSGSIAAASNHKLGLYNNGSFTNNTPSASTASIQNGKFTLKAVLQGNSNCLRIGLVYNSKTVVIKNLDIYEEGAKEYVINNNIVKDLSSQIDKNTSNIDGLIQGAENKEVEEGVYYLFINSSLTRYTGGQYSLSPFIPITNGDTVTWSGGFVGTADNVPVLCLYDENKTLYDYYASNSDPRTVTISSSSARYCRFAFLNTNIGAYISVNGVNKFVWDGVFYRTSIYTKEEVDELLNEKADVNSNNEKLPLVDLVNSDTQNGSLYDNPSYNSKRVTSRSALVVPKVGRIWNVKLPDNISLYLLVGHSMNPSSTHPAGWVTNGGSFAFTDEMLIYRPVFAKGASHNSTLSASEVIEMVENGEIELYSVIEKEENTSSRLRCCDAQVGAARWIRTNTLADNQLNRLPTFAHLSDVHGDYERYRHCIEYCLGLYGGIDGVLDTGDAAIWNAPSGTTFRVSLANEFAALTFLGVCIGNHEAFASSSPVPNVFENNIQELASIYNYLSADNTVTVKTYWYKDFADKQIRIISLDMHEGGYYKGNYSQAQITWFINTLKSTPSGYGVILMHHETEDNLDAIVGKTDFNQVGFNSQAYAIDGKKIIANIIDAFIARSTYSDTYTENGFSYYGTGNGSGESVTVNADFTTISDDTIEFIAHLVGHSHRDFIGKYRNSTQYQLCLMVSTGNCLCPWQQNPEWANSSDLPRGDSGLTQDLFNIYCIDRDNGTIRIARVGSDITEQMEYRKMMIVPYK